jgi:DNA-binding GntR family transcriptional regulator
LESTFTPASLTPTLPLQIAERIGAAIVEEKFAPGERLKEVDLAAAFGVSRASIREALRLLEHRGLVRILPQRGAQVTLLSLSELENLFEIRAVLLGLASRHAARNFRAPSRAALDARLRALTAARTDLALYARASAAIVATIATLSDNEQLAEMLAGFAQRIGRYTLLGLATQARRDRSLANWKKAVQAIRGNDEEIAEHIHRRLALENRDAALEALRLREAASKPSRPKSADGPIGPRRPARPPPRVTRAAPAASASGKAPSRR